MSKESEAEPVSTEFEPQDLLDVDVDAIAKEIDRRASGEDSVPDQDPVEEKVEEPQDETDEPVEVEAEAADEADAGDDPETAEDDDPVASRLSALEQRLEQEALQRQAQEAKNEHLRFMLDRRSGEIGHLKNQLRQFERPERQDDDGDYTPERSSAARRPESDELRGELEQLRTERVARAAQETYLQLQQDNAQFWEAVGKRDPAEAEEFQKSWNDKFQKELSDLDAASAVGDGDVKRVSSILRAAYKSALASTRLEWLGRKTAGRKTLADQSSKLKERKLAAASGTTGSRPKARPRPKSLDEMSADEIKREIDRRSAQGL